MKSPTMLNLTLQSHFGPLRNVAAGALNTLYFGLWFGPDPVPGSGDNTGEPAIGVGGYARVAKVNDATLWGAIAPTDTTITNKGSAGAITWPAATGAYSCGPATELRWWTIYSAPVGGAMLYATYFWPWITVAAAGDIPRIPANTLSVYAYEPVPGYG